jgi:hypothetical protein
LKNEEFVDIHTPEFQSNMGNVTMKLEESLLQIVKYRDSECPKVVKKALKKLVNNEKIDITSESKRVDAFAVAITHLCSNTI